MTSGSDRARAYDAMYMERARSVLGCMLDYAVNELGFELGEFWRLFLTSGLSRDFEHGVPHIVAGRSGVELAHMVLEELGRDMPMRRPKWALLGRSEEYWCGWALAYYQWERNLAFGDIEERMPIARVLGLYDPYHEMDVRQFADRLDEECCRADVATRLQTRRRQAGLSQAELARASGVAVRSIQQYEQRRKSINRAAASQVAALAHALSCTVEDLLEPVFTTHEMAF